VLTFVLQLSASRVLLERFGVALTASTPSLALLFGGVGALAAPGFGSIMLARAGEAVFRGSVFRTGYEVFFTPISAEDKRAAKSIIDVGFDRLGDVAGGTLVRTALLLAPAVQSTTILLLALAASAGAVLAASRLNRGYIRTLEKSLLDRADGIAAPFVSSCGAMDLDFDSLRRQRLAGAVATDDEEAADSPRPVDLAALDPEVRDILHLRSRNRNRIVDVLARQEGLSGALVPHAIPLLAWDPVAEYVVFALRKVAEEHVGELVDALIDPNQAFLVRLRLVQVFSVCVSQRAADGLLHGLDDVRFDVRFQSARSLAEIMQRNPLVRLDAARVHDVVLREVSVGRPIWESRRLLDGVERRDASSLLDAFVIDRACASLTHVFTLLSLVLPQEPIQVAFRGLHSGNRQLRGTALEYLDGVLPEAIRNGLWPFLERRPLARQTRPREEVIAELLESHHSVTLNLEELRRRRLAGDWQSTT
jgi:AAA family ATP:ADP antiporter